MIAKASTVRFWQWAARRRMLRLRTNWQEW